MLFIIIFLGFTTAALVGYVVVPSVFGAAVVTNQRRRQKLANNMENLMPRKEAKQISRAFLFIPFISTIGFYILFPSDFKLFGAVIGLTLGSIFPSFYIKLITRYSREKFQDQLVDALMIMSSSFRGGLSLIQAMEAVVDEMPDPINKEFGIVLGENKMGVSLDEALQHLYNRMPSTALQQMITAILLARETGGNLPVIFSRIVTNIRENKKIQKNLDTLTLQGKIQGFVMALLPVAFGFVIYSANRRVFDHMLQSETGRAMLMYAVVSELIGAFLVWKISSFKEF